MSTKKTPILAAMLMMGALAMPAMAQNDQTAPPPGGNTAGNTGGDNNNGGGRRFDPSQFRQQMMDRIKQEMGATDDEFAALQPKIEKVMQLNRDANGGGMGGMMGRRNRGGNNGGGASGATASPNTQDPNAPQPSAVQQAQRDLRTTLDNKDAKPEDIKAKLDALRDAKSKAKDDLTAAQKDLQSLLTQRQEAVLVMMGLLN
jgi:hypothetical protein